MPQPSETDSYAQSLVTRNLSFCYALEPDEREECYTAISAVGRAGASGTLNTPGSRATARRAQELLSKGKSLFEARAAATTRASTQDTAVPKSGDRNNKDANDHAPSADRGANNGGSKA